MAVGSFDEAQKWASPWLDVYGMDSSGISSEALKSCPSPVLGEEGPFSLGGLALDYAANGPFQGHQGGGAAARSGQALRSLSVGARCAHPA